MSLTRAVHLFVENSFTEPFLGFMAHMKRNPSLVSPRVARNLASGLNAIARIPKECSVRIEIGVSCAESAAVEKIMTRGL